MMRYCIYFPDVKMSDKRFVSCSAIILIYCCCYLFRDSIRNLHVYFKTMFGSSLPPVVCRRLMSYLPLLCLFPLSGVQHISCCVFVLFVFVLCMVVSNTYCVGLLFFVFFVLCTQCCQFFWTVHS